jgi:hypothetical protein
VNEHWNVRRTGRDPDDAGDGGILTVNEEKVLELLPPRARATAIHDREGVSGAA